MWLSTRKGLGEAGSSKLFASYMGQSDISKISSISFLFNNDALLIPGSQGSKLPGFFLLVVYYD